MAQERTGLLVVCEGNICRSPLGSLILESDLAGISDVDVSSAGLRAVTGSGMDKQAAKHASRFSLDPSRHVAKRLTEQMIGQSAVILTMSVEQRTRVVQLSPLAMRRTFTLNEFAEIARSAPSMPHSGIALLGALAKWGDSKRTSYNEYDLDIDDPYRRDDLVHRRVADEIYAASKAISMRFNV